MYLNGPPLHVHCPPRYVNFREVLFDSSGRRLRERIAAARFGQRVVDVAHVAEALEGMLGEPRPLSRPVRVFISYRWGMRAENDWVRDLARRLKERGCVVFLDRDQKDTPPTIGHVVAKVARCHVFLMVVDPGYVERVGGSERDRPHRLDRGWAYVEFRVSEMLPMPLQRIGVLRSGRRVPGGMRLLTKSQSGNIMDASTSKKLDVALDTLFPVRGSCPSKDVALKAAQLLHDSAEAAFIGDGERSWCAALEAAELVPDVSEAQLSLLTASLRMRRPADAGRAAVRLLELDPTRSIHRHLASVAFAALGNGNEAVAHAVPINFNHPTGDWLGHFVLATALWAAGQRRAAVGHLRVGLKTNRNFEGRFHAWLAKADRSAPPQPLPLAADDFPVEPPVIPVLPFDGMKPGTDLPLGVAVCVELGARVPGSTLIVEYILTVVSQAALGPGRLHIAGIDNRDLTSQVICESCEHAIPVDREGLHIVCWQCGGERSFRPGETPSACLLCGCDMLIPLRQAFVAGGRAGCPYCRSGTFRPWICG